MAAMFRGNFLINTLYRSKTFQYCLNRDKYSIILSRVAALNNLYYVFCHNDRPNLPILKAAYFKNECHSEYFYSSRSKENRPKNLDSLIEYENVAEETMQSLYDRFEEVLQDSKFPDYDVNYSNDVLTVELKEKCVYVINKQTPNRQIWLSSPISGPKRYDYIDGVWIYKHDGISLHQLLSKELTDLLEINADFLTCTYSN